MQGAQNFHNLNHIRGRKVTSLGVLFDFAENAHNTTVQKVADMVKETWVRSIQFNASYQVNLRYIVCRCYQGRA